MTAQTPAEQAALVLAEHRMWVSEEGDGRNDPAEETLYCSSDTCGDDGYLDGWVQVHYDDVPPDWDAAMDAHRITVLAEAGLLADHITAAVDAACGCCTVVDTVGLNALLDHVATLTASLSAMTGYRDECERQYQATVEAWGDALYELNQWRARAETAEATLAEMVRDHAAPPIKDQRGYDYCMGWFDAVTYIDSLVKTRRAEGDDRG